MSPRLISVVVPIYCEELVLDELYRRLTSSMSALSPRYIYELVFVNDGSTDRSLEILRGYAEKDSSVRVLDLSRNFGQQLAITAGVDEARGDAVVLIDADLQDPPEVIARMVEKWEEGYEVVYGTRTRRDGENIFKLATSRVFYRVLNNLSDVDLPLDTGDFRLMDRTVVNQLVLMREENRYLRGMVTWIGFRQYALPYERDARFAGQTKYNMRRLVRLALDGITSFSSKPLRVSTNFGMFITLGAFLYLAWTIAGKLIHPETVTPGYASIIVIILFLSGVQLISIGVLGDYIGRIFYEAKQRPLYVVARKFGFEDETSRVETDE